MMTSGVPSNWDSLVLHLVNPTGKEIGRGAYGRVFEVDYEGTLCAAKEVHSLLLQYAQGDDLRKIIDDFLNECQIWSTIRHPCIVQFLGVYYPAMDQYRLPVMVMEKMQHSLRGLVENYDNIPLNVKLSILDEVCLGLRYLHSRNPPIVHRDLTPNNILLGGHLEAKITDLGVAKVMRSDNQKTKTKLPGTPDFMPPEALSIRPVYGPSLDVFSFGGVILNVITQLWPGPTDLLEFNTNTGKREVVSEVRRRQQYLDKMTGAAADLKPLVMSCLNDNPKNRPLVAQVSMTIKRAKEMCSQKDSRDGMSPITWLAEVSSNRQSQVTSSLTTALEEMTINNEQLRRENDVLKTDNTQLRINDEAIKDGNIQLQGKEKDKIGQLATLLNSQRSEIAQLITENKILKAEQQQLKDCTFDELESVEPKPKPSVNFDTHNTVIPSEANASMQSSQLYAVLPPCNASSTMLAPADDSHDMSHLLSNGCSAEYRPPPPWTPKQSMSPMQQLINLGFGNRQLNDHLLHKHHNNIQAVVNELLDAMLT